MTRRSKVSLSPRSIGLDRERRAKAILERLGYLVSEPIRGGFGNKDIFGAFDLLALARDPPDGFRPVLLVQVSGDFDHPAVRQRSWPGIPGVSYELWREKHHVFTILRFDGKGHFRIERTISGTPPEAP